MRRLPLLFRRCVVPAAVAALAVSAAAGVLRGAEGTGRLRVEIAGRIRVPELREISGIAASLRNHGVFWVHNDSGGLPRLYALRADGSLVAKLDVTGAQARDWEDIAAGPGTRAGVPHQLYIADTGDNLRVRKSVVIYRIPEPLLGNVGGGTRLRSEPADVFPLRYPRGPEDCEALVVETGAPRVYLFTKRPDGVGVYRADLGEPGRERTLEAVGLLRGTAYVTGAALSPCGCRLALRSYGAITEYVAGRPLGVRRLIEGAAMRYRGPPEPQGEAITYGWDGKALYTASEGPAPMLYRLVPEEKGGSPKEAGR